MIDKWRARLSPTARGGLIYSVFLSGNAFFLPFLSVYYAERGLSGSEIGLLGALGPLMSLFIAPVLVSFADRHGWQVALLRLNLVCSGIVFLLFPLTGSFATLLPVATAFAFAACSIFSLTDGLAAQLAARHNVSYGRMRLWGSAVFAVLPAVAGVLWQRLGLLLMFPVTTFFYLITSTIVPLLGEKKEGPTMPPPSVRLSSLQRRFWVVLVCSFFLSLGMSMMRIFASVHFVQLGGHVLVGVYAAVAAAVEVPVMLAHGAIMDRLGGARTLLLSYAVAACSYLSAFLITDPVLLPLAAILQGLGYATFVPTTVRLVNSWAPPQRGATYQGLMNIGIQGLAPLAASLLGGMIFDALGVRSVLVASSGAAMVALLLMLTAQVARRRFDEPQPVTQ
jgi:PPP family 3-phenylpropionic acid transporter